MGIAIGGAALFGLFLLAWSAIGRKYKVLFNPAHLGEFGEVLWKARGSALANPGADPSKGATDAGLAVLYSVTPTAEGLLQHHVSMSWRGGHFAQAAGSAYIVFLHRMLEIPPDVGITMFQSRRGVFHIAWDLNAAQHACFSAVKLELPTAEELPAVLAECNRAKRQLLPIKIEDIPVH